MADARIYFFSEDGRIKFGDWIACKDAEDARAIASELAGGHAAVEIWNRATRLVRVEREKAA